MKHDNILYLCENKKETKAWFQALGTQKLPLGGKRSGFIRSISQISPKSQGKEQKSRKTAETEREYLELAAPVDGFLTNIELKTGVFEYIGIEKAVIDMLEEFNIKDRIILSSFNHYTILRCREIAPEIKTGFLTETWIIDMWDYAKKYGVECIHPEHYFLTDEYFAKMKKAGVEVNTWTVNTEEDILRLSAMGVDSLIGNYPDLMVKLLKK